MDREAHVRESLGVPESASEVVVVAESTHWDPNWLVDSERYYRWCVRPTLDRVMAELRGQPRRIFSLECVFFVERYWRDRPGERADFAELVNQGRLRFTGSGVTTPDTLLPEDEMLLRDALVGQEWLRAHGMTQQPRLWYLPDSFGHTPGLPSLLAAAGFDYATVCRIDGMRFPGADLEAASHFPRPGSSAAHLIEAGTADFVWRSNDDNEVLTHWMSRSYGQGDMIASGGLSRALGLPIAWPDRRPSHVDRRVEEYLAHLRPLARTPYRLLPIGIDFARPVPDLVGLLDAWNDRHHGATGTWLVNAAIDDYLDLVAAHRGDLPIIDFDPNPYWTGFYASRPAIKSATRELGRRIVAEDDRRARDHLEGREPGALTSAQRAARWTAAVANHHDYVTGTAPDWVALGEQTRWLTEALAATPPERAPIRRSDAGVLGSATMPRVQCEGTRVSVEASWGTAVFDESHGGALVSLTDNGGRELLAGPSLVLHAHFDSGGLWRMGQEIYGGRFKMVDSTGTRSATIRTRCEGGVVRVTVTATLEGRTAVLEHTLGAGESTIVTRTSVHPRLRRTVTLVMRPGHDATGLVMHQPGGWVTRPLERWYRPTYWPLHSFAVLTVGDARETARLAVASQDPTGMSTADDGTTEVVVARSAVKEIAYRCIPVMAPAWGRKWTRQEAVVATGWVPSGSSAVTVGRHLGGLVDHLVGRLEPVFCVTSDDPDVEVIAVKPADRGDGVIVRLRDWSDAGVTRSVRIRPAAGLDVDELAATLADARERDLNRGALASVNGSVVVPLSGHLTSVRLTRR